MTGIPNIPSISDLATLARNAAVEGAVWSIQSSDLNANLVVLETQNIGEHVNNEVDVLVVGVLGEGVITADGSKLTVGSGHAVLIPKGSRREIHSVGGRFAYLTVHRRRQGLWPSTPGR